MNSCALAQASIDPSFMLQETPLMQPSGVASCLCRRLKKD
jgi:hypothetical protein